MENFREYYRYIPLKKLIIFRKCIKLHPIVVSLPRLKRKLGFLSPPSRVYSTGDLMLPLLPGNASSRSSKRGDTFIVVRTNCSGKAAVGLLTFWFLVLITRMLPRLFVALRRPWSARVCVWHSLSLTMSPLGRGNGSTKSLIVQPMERFLC